ncbi:MAG: 1-(5-phosphoribosyl)-5-[(5-phosphoribosylamino)methylideneamino]imidazole-4-carboxamide isomerase [Bacillota bacterium]|nr:1-(5-phosphoribosyl)-5-[(5-phosphoribosylamino)methylideneamino]imidazole-4-carboxamide isomerase [Bacillota bacterium]
MIIFPAIDLKDGQCVRLVQGLKENKTVYSDSPGEIARKFENDGAEFLHVVDLDGAFEGSTRNRAAIQQIASSLSIPFQVGGGLRTREAVEAMLQLGASRVIIGTKAVRSPAFVEELIWDFGPEKIILGLDAKDGKVAVEGWVEKSQLDVLDFANTMREAGIKTAIYTDVSRDGLLKGPNLEAIERMARESGLQIIASGGVSTPENIKALKAIESLGVCGAIIGKALYEGKITIQDALNAAH